MCIGFVKGKLDYSQLQPVGIFPRPGDNHDKAVYFNPPDPARYADNVPGQYAVRAAGGVYGYPDAG